MSPPSGRRADRSPERRVQRSRQARVWGSAVSGGGLSAQDPPDGTEWSALVANELGRESFRTTGMVAGTVGDVAWILIDPIRHPLRVWAGSGMSRRRYQSPAAPPACVTNGPMMGRSIGGVPVRRTTLLTITAAAAGLAAYSAVAACGEREPRGARAALRAVAAGIAAGISTAGWALTGWAPCGIVISASSGLEDRTDFDGEGRRHAWLGRSGRSFDTYRIGDGHPDAAMVEACGGLVRLVADGTVVSGGDAARLRNKRPCVAWGLVPMGDALPSGQRARAGAGHDGVLVVLASSRRSLADLGPALAQLGARDAVATDPSGSAAASWLGEHPVGPPALPRRAIQRYGISCGS